MTSLRIGLAQTRQTGELAANAQTILRYLDRAAEQGVQILCFPETQTVGYRVDIAEIDGPSPVEALDRLHTRVAERCAECVSERLPDSIAEHVAHRGAQRVS